MADSTGIKGVCEAALMVADEPLDVEQLLALWMDAPVVPQRAEIRDALQELQRDYSDRGVQLREVASGYRFQTRPEFAPQLNKLWESRAPRYSRALLETIAIIAYRQPVTRGEIEAIRGVAVSTQITRTLIEREWIRIAGHRDVPGRPAVYATTRTFLDYFGLKSLADLPDLAELRDIEDLNRDLFADQSAQLLAQAEEPDDAIGTGVELPLETPGELDEEAVAQRAAG